MNKGKKKAIKPIAKGGGKMKKPSQRQSGRSEEGKKLRVLILEDNPADAELMERQLKRNGIAFVPRRTATRSGFLLALNSFKPDVILADYSLPKFNALQALALRKKNAPLTPFIIVTGSISEEIAVECMKKGADDYLLKDRPARLGEAIKHALEKFRLQIEKMAAEESLQANELLYRTFIDSSTDMAFLKDNHFRHLLANQALCGFFGKPEKEILGKTDSELMERKAARACRKSDQQALVTKGVVIQEETFGERTLEIRKFPVKLTNGRIGIGGYIRDISERTRTQDQIEHAKRKWTITFDAIKDGIALLAVDQTVRQVNRAFANLVKKPFPEIIGKKCYELIHSDRQPDPHYPFTKMLKSKKRESIELAVADRVFEMLVDPITNDAGAISGAVLIMTDITERKWAEEALRESEEQYRDLIEKGNIAIVIDDIDGNLIYFNNQFLNLFGYSAGEIKGKTHKEFIHPDSFEIISKYHEKRMQGEKIPSRYEFKGIRKDGSRINVEIDVCEIIKKESKASGTRSYMWDITERKKTEDALIDSENRYRNHFESSSEFYFTLDLKGNFIDVNQAAVALTGYAKSELLKMNFKDYTPKRDHRKLFLTLSNIYKTGKPVQNILVEATIKNKSKKYFETSISLMKKGEQIIGFHGSSKDITERKRAEEALRGSEQKYRTMIEQSNDMIWTLDTEGNLTFFNRRSEEISGHRFEDWRGKSFVPLIVEEDLPLVADVFRRTLNGESQHYEVRVKKEDGNIFTLSVNTAPILEAGKVVGTVSFGRDITERKQAEEKIKMLSFVVEQSTEGMAIAGLDGILSFVNEAWCRMHGYKSSKELLGKSLAIFHDQEQMENEVKPFNEKVIELGANSGEVGHKTRDGKLFPTLMTSTLLKDKQGMPYAMAGIAKDITERKRAEEELKTSENRYRRLFDESPVSLWEEDFSAVKAEIDRLKGSGVKDFAAYFAADERVLDLIGRLRVLDVNRATLELYGAASKKEFQERLPRLFAERTLPVFREEFVAIAAGATSFQREIESETFSGKPLTLALCWEVSPEYRESLQLVLVSIVDITAKKRVLLALQESEERYRQLVELSPDAIAVHFEGKVVFVNPAAVKLMGAQRAEELLGKPALEMVHPDFRSIAMERIRQSIKQGSIALPVMEKFIRVDGSSVDVEVSAIPIVYQGKQAMQVIVRDITERKLAAEQMQVSLREKEVLLKEIHHRVKNNLQVISGLLTLQAEHIGDERLQRLLKESQGRIWTMALIHQTLYQSGNLADIDMADYIRNLAGNLLSSHARVAMPPTINFNLLPLRLVIDKAIPMALIINELVTNAMKHAFPDGRPGEIRISLQERRGVKFYAPTEDTGTAPGSDRSRPVTTEQKNAPSYELTVADNGVGLPTGFDLKNQKSLGLQLVTMLTKQLGGSLAIEASGGTSVHIIFGNNEKNK